MNKRALSVVITLLMILAVVPAAFAYSATSTLPSFKVADSISKSNDSPLKEQLQKILNSGKQEVRLIIAPKDGYEMQVFNELKKIGKIDPISKPEFKFIVITVSKDKLSELENINGIFKVWEDKEIKLPPVFHDEGYSIKKGVSEPNMFMSIFTINAYNTWNDYGVYGDNVTVAIIDTGVDPIHPFLQQTLNGEKKIIDWKDFTEEGHVDTSYTATIDNVTNGILIIKQNISVDWGTYGLDVDAARENITSFYIENVTIGNITSANGIYHFGLLPERYFDLDFDQNFNEAHFVLVVNSSEYYDTVYIDTDDDLDLTDEVPAHIYTKSYDIIRFGPGLLEEPLEYDINNEHIRYPYYPISWFYKTIYNAEIGVVIGDIDPSGDEVSLGWDGGQHGTHVAGTVAGVGLAGTDLEGIYGVAPNARIMAIRALRSVGWGATSAIINAMIYAAIYGPDNVAFSGDEADVINMSLGGLAEYNDGLESPENFYVNYLTELTGVVFSISAGNSGPSTNTVGSPGDADFAITVGNYWEGNRWYMFYGFPGVIDGPAMSSSRGPRMDGLLDPDVMAPGTDIVSSVPVWDNTYSINSPYDYYSGTSMAAPHVAGAVALLIDYAKRNGIEYNPFKIKEALMLSAKKLDGATLIDQGFGLIQVDKAIEELEKLSSEPTTMIYAGTTFTGYKNPIDKKLIPTIMLNDYFTWAYDVPYLYKGVYARNVLPIAVPIYAYVLKWDEDYNYFYVGNGTYKVSTNVDWIKPSVDEVTITENGTMFYITIDYSKLQKPGTYVGLIYIDDPNTEFLEGYVPVTITIPINKNGELGGKISDTEKPGQAKHYYFDVPRGTQMLEVTIRIPTDDEGNPLGRTRLVIAKPTGVRVISGSYMGAGGSTNEYTYYIQNPDEGMWEITAYSSVSTGNYGLSEAQYEIEVKAYSITVEPALIRADFDTPGVKEITAEATNTYETVNTSIIGIGVGRLDLTYVWVENVSQDMLKTMDIIEANESLYYMNVGITQPEDPSADLDLYVYYYKTWDQLANDINDGIIDNYTRRYIDQIGPTSDEHLELFMPAQGYYMVIVHGYDTVGYNPIQFIYYEQILTDNGDVNVDTTPFEFAKGETKTITANVNLSEEGTYLGVLGIKDVESGATLGYSPMILQVGKPEMYVALMGTPTIGEPSLLTLKILDKATLEPIEGETKVIINGQEYYAEDGELKFYYTPTSLDAAKFNVKVISDDYKDFEGEFELTPKEPFTEYLYESNRDSTVISGDATITTFDTKHGEVAVTVEGNTGETAVVMITLPLDAYFIEVTGEHVVSYYIEKGQYAQYIFVTVKFASAADIKITYKTSGDIIRTMDVVWYMLYNKYNAKFNETYAKALELGVDDETIQEAQKYKELADQYYKDAWQFGHPLQGYIQAVPYLRKAYINIKNALDILNNAIEALEAS
ncbi:hypothetical protein PAP_01300 [Palaeococcus pacificus DY20341]|uniref:Peptidase S8/S53 domain-containing protein n=1 Tax=Palaeococcus pacificus DY20341 TaxID=1343739 RepID=A0A075LRZ0_9EURY|nr:S8 family serine peptidase [Palaeococcus pacificus]AIF68702.1 hypothetical protein PAP_01300 [Palaeococcus pacificus DY20341]